MIDYPLGTHYQVEHCVKNQLIWLRTLGEQESSAQLWLRNPRDATAFQIHPEEIHRN